MPMNMAGRIAKYLAISLAMENVVSAPRVMRSCLPMATTSMSLVGLLSRSTILPASLAAMVPVFMARPTSAWDAHEHGRQDREIFGDIVGDGKRGERAARHEELFADGQRY